MMQYLLAVQIDESAPPPPPDDTEETYGQVDRVNDELRAAGVWVFAGGLLPSESSTVVRVDGGTTTTTDGPFAETKEQLGGFWVIRAADLDQALAWAEKCARACGCPIEVRPFDDPAQ